MEQAKKAKRSATLLEDGRVEVRADAFTVKTVPMSDALLTAFPDLAKQVEAAKPKPKKRGRPKKSENVDNDSSGDAQSGTE